MPDMLITLRNAVEKAYGCKAKCVGKVTVHEKRHGRTVWYGTVHVFELFGHERASRAYAWTIIGGGGEAPQVATVLHKGLVAGPSDAVRAVMTKIYLNDAERDESIEPDQSK